MCYLIAKRHSQPGCIAVQTEGGKALADLVSYLGPKLLNKGIQILTISDPEIYREYEPFRFLEAEKEFIDACLNSNF